MSEPPPGAVLITNSTGFVGCAATRAVAVAAAVRAVVAALLAAGDPAGAVAAPPQAATVSVAATMTAMNLDADCRTIFHPHAIS